MTRPRCAACNLPMDPANTDRHAGDCLTPIMPLPQALIREYATTHDVLSSNDLRPLFASFGLKPAGSHFTAAVNAGVIRKAGHVASTEQSTKAHEVRVYQSLISRQAIEERRVA